MNRFALASAAALLVLTGCAHEPPPVSAKVQAYYDAMVSAEQTSKATTAPQLTVFVGDSYAAGSGSTKGGWPDLLASRSRWKYENLALGGTGYLQQSGFQGCGQEFCPNYLERIPAIVEAKPTRVIVAGGRNDVLRNQEEVRAAADEFFEELRAQLPEAQIIALSPVWDASEPPAQLAEVAGSVKQTVTAAGGTYVDVGHPLAGHTEWIIADGVHPNDDGHAALAAAAQRALRAAGVL